MPRPERPLDAGDTPLLRFAADLRALRAKAGNPTYRELGIRAHYSAPALSEAAGGRKLPTKAMTLAYVAACGGDVREWERRWHEVAEQLAPPRANPSSTEDCPYPGLAAFQISDANRFFGRDSLLAELRGQVREHRFVGVFGASGSGKSSLLHAGLAASEKGPVVVMTPGARPFQECAVRLAALTGESAPALLAEFTADRANLHLRVSQALTERAEDDLLLVIDQFEEVFTLARDDAARLAFVDAIVWAAGAERSRVRVVLGVRADFFGHCGEIPALRDALRDATVLVGAMTPEELREAITRPAADAGLAAETPLVTRIVADASKEPAVLPLVSHALRETWLRRHGIALTLAAYEAAGGIHHAIARTAEAVFTRFDEDQRETARQVFLRLVALNDGAEDTKRRLNRSELDEESAAVLAELTDSRLVTVSQDHVEITHEALITHWPRLREWLTQDRVGLRTHRLLTQAAAEWDVLGRDPGALYRGAKLALVQDWVQRTDARLTATERAFFLASTTANRRQSSRLRRFAALLGVLLVAVSGTTVYSLVEQRRIADDLRREALQKVENDVANNTSLSPSLVSELAVADYRLDPTPQHRGQLFRLWAGVGSGASNVSTTMAVFDPSSSFTAFADARAGVWLHSQPTGAPVAAIPATGASILAIAVSADGSHVAVSYQDGRTNLWNTAAPGAPALVHSWAGEPSYLTFSPDGAVLAISQVQPVRATPAIQLWNVHDPAFAAPERVWWNAWGHVAFSADSRRIAAQTLDAHGEVQVLPSNFPPQRQPPAQNPPDGYPPARQIALSPDGSTVVTLPSVLASDPNVRVQSVSPGGDVRNEATLAVGGRPQPVYGAWPPVFSQDGKLVVEPDGPNGVAVWDMRDPRHPREYAAVPSADGQVLAASISPDNRLSIVTTDTDVSVPLDVDPTIAAICGRLRGYRPAPETWSSYFPDMDVPIPC